MVQHRLSSRLREPHRLRVCPTVIWGPGGQDVHYESWPTRSRCSSLLALVCTGCMYSSMTKHSTSAPRELHLPGAAISGGGAELPRRPIQSRSSIVERGALPIHCVLNTRVPSHSNTVGEDGEGKVPQRWPEAASHRRQPASFCLSVFRDVTGCWSGLLPGTGDDNARGPPSVVLRGAARSKFGESGISTA